MGGNVYIIAGPIGAGKTTFAQEFLPNYARCPNFVNADIIADRYFQCRRQRALRLRRLRRCWGKSKRGPNNCLFWIETKSDWGTRAWGIAKVCLAWWKSSGGTCRRVTREVL